MFRVNQHMGYFGFGKFEAMFGLKILRENVKEKKKSGMKKKVKENEK